MLVFVGPSLESNKAVSIVDADFRPPIRRGDLDIVDGHDVVVIIDGEFGGALSVSPKEILVLLDQGKTVIGASSMGALRAAELNEFGMIGIGWVFERFKKSAVRNEADVALTFSPATLRPLTIPIVNIDYWAEQLEYSGIIDRRIRRKLVQAARKIFFADRTQRRLEQVLRQIFSQDEFKRISNFVGAMPDVKAIDATRALKYAACQKISCLNQYE